MYTSHTAVDVAAVRRKLFPIVMPPEAQQMLDQGMSASLVQEMFVWELLPNVVVERLVSAVTGRDRWARDESAVHAFCEHVVEVCESWQMTYGILFNAISASPVKIPFGGGWVASRVGMHTWYVKDASGMTQVHDGYELLTVLAPLATWWLLDVPQEKPVHPLFAIAGEEIDAGKVAAELAAAIIAELLP